MSSGCTDPTPPAVSTADVWAYVALGSNLGDSLAVLRAAAQRLAALSDESLARSSVWRSAPIDCPPGSPSYLNAVVALHPRPGETPESLLHQLQELEREFGRRPKKIMNEPRPLDLDLLSFGDCRCRTRELTLPHPRAHLRRFVLAPWAEIAASFIPPGWEACVQRVLHELDTEQAIERVPERI